MRLRKFMRNAKKEFDENYNEEKIVIKKEKKFSARWVFLYVTLGIIFIFPMVFGLVYSNNDSFEIVPIGENETYRSLSSISNNNLKIYISERVTKGGTGDKTIPETTVVPGTNISDTKKLDISYQTNNQEDGIIEPDIAKFDGKYCYYLYRGDFYIYDLDGNILVYKKLFENGSANYSNLQVYNNRIIAYDYNDFYIFTFDKELIENTHYHYHVIESRIYQDSLYIIGVFFDIKEYSINNCYYDKSGSAYFAYFIQKYNLDTLSMQDVELTTSNNAIVYMNDTNVVISYYDPSYNCEKTLNAVFNLDLSPVGVFICDGRVNDQYSLDIYQKNLRVVTTTSSNVNILTIFDISSFKMLSVLNEGIGLPGETVKSVSFTDDTCYIVTFRNTDPLYEIDIKDPKNPIIVGEIHVDGYSSYLKPFTIDGIRYVIGAGVINGNYKYSVYKNGDTNEQIGEDYIIDLEIQKASEASGTVSYVQINNSAVDPHAMFFYQKENYLYFGAPINAGKYVLYKVDVFAEEVIKAYKEFDTTSETRLFLYNGKVYLPQLGKIIIEEF